MNQNQRNKIIEDLLANPNFNPNKLINPNRYVNVLGLDSLVKYQSKEDFDKFLKYVADGMKEQGTKPAIINRTLSHYIHELKNNGFKFQSALNSMVDNAEAYDPDDDYGTEFEHNIASFEGGMENYDKDQSKYEDQIIHVYNQLHGK